MFGKLKDKLKSWIQKAKEKVEETEVVETKEEIKEEKKAKKKLDRKLEKQQKKEEKREEIIEEKPEINEEIGEAIEVETEIGEGISEEDEKEIEKVEEEMKSSLSKDNEKTRILEVPQKFNVGLEKYEPDVDKIKEKISELDKLEEQKEEELKELEKKSKKGFFSKLKSGFKYKIGENEFNDIFDDLEMLLLENNVALEAVEDIRKILSEKLIGKELKKDKLEEEIKHELKNTLNEILIDPDDPVDAIKIKKKEGKPFVILFFGINGTGKTTSIAKMTYLLKEKGFSVVLAAADTFRAASIEQIQIHADKLEVPLVKHDYGSDPAAVGFDAIKYAEKHKKDVVLIDTAGRMHTKINLLAEMEKVCRVTNPDLKIFVAESIAGNDATEQAKSFNDMIEIDGAILSKADIDEKGGTIISVSHAIHKPIFYLGTGQEYKDLKLFDKQKFIDGLGL
ncbi:MAG: signal recognition particle-docking protein FtsY [Candidatus Pacearchaeota archaeon]